jgi:hypothetical protein
MEATLGDDIDKYDVGEGRKVWSALMEDQKYEKFARYWKTLKARESFKKTFDEVSGCVFVG